MEEAAGNAGDLTLMHMLGNIQNMQDMQDMQNMKNMHPWHGGGREKKPEPFFKSWEGFYCVGAPNRMGNGG